MGFIEPAQDGGHAVERTIDLPHGFGQWVFMLFTTDFSVRVPGGTAVGAPGDILINSPTFPQWHQGITAPFHNYWFHFDGPDINKALDRYGVPVNVPVRVASPFRCLPSIQSMHREHSFREVFSDEALHALVHAVLRDISRQLGVRTRLRLTARDMRHLDVLHDLRVEMWRHPDRPWSVSTIAERAGLSESRVLHVYRRLFSRSPVDDLIAARIERAKSLLTGTHASVSEVADRCGFSTIYYFSRAFRQRTGLSPSQFRRGTQE